MDISLKELGKSGDHGGMASFRRGDITLYWIPLQGLDAYALNLFAPRDHAFWNFGIFDALNRSHYEYCHQRTRGDPKVYSMLTKLNRQTGHKKRSGLARATLGAWSTGVDFLPESYEMDFYQLGFRHMSLAVPMADRTAVQSHFESQVCLFKRHYRKPI